MIHEPKPFKQIAIGVDFSENSTATLHWVSQHFAPNSAIDLIHSVEVPRIPEFIRNAFPRFEEWEENHTRGAQTRLAEFGSSCETMREAFVFNGRPFDILVKVAETSDTDLIAVGAEGEHRGLGKLVGSTPVRLLENSKLPVLVVRDAKDRPLKRILLAIDDSSMTAQVIAEATRAVASSGAEIVLMTATPTWFIESMRRHGGGSTIEGIQEQQIAEATKWLKGIAEANGFKEAEQIVEAGSPDIEILNVAKRIDADLIIMGTKGSSQAAHPFVGSCARYVLNNARCPVLFVVGQD